jgi:hypothetical protein
VLRPTLMFGWFDRKHLGWLRQRHGGTHDVSGLHTITYGALIRMIHDIVQPRARIVNIPYSAFWALLWLYAKFDRNLPFTVKQLEALVIPETFPVTDWPDRFGVTPTPLEDALRRTFTDPRYRDVVLEF